ncbi:lantibiotic immunity ABC transporter MutE/EpiE family permease subunit [Thermoactinomyces mirandus]|uniref:Lantibiotic immunity ABC transporter MutE/EpiE family permease subunit n=1 Tax=Thermoactinomyces mirandus TaxID=2756294 RepID=A0A7W2ARK7_9BACL|nr:lantibiotic immunity ABC transporter MutE/EpiE family permease subunit [Thermoactinomyces mirandus]MBA4603079.1 lantibiotic immunity ABC transporter MutE/EpiE family permease subunit [Thermoactinomyces mirandus]
MNMIQSELLKYKGTFTRKLILLAPLLFVINALLQKLFMPVDYSRSWQLLIALVYNWWPVIFVPLGIALLAALGASQEKKAGNYRYLRAMNISPARIWSGKVIVMALHTLVAAFFLMVATVISGFISADGPVPWLKIFTGGLVIWVASLAIIPIQLWVASWKGTFYSMTAGFAGMIAGVLAAPKSCWVYVPWSWPTRLMCPIIGVHPNGILLEATDPLRDASSIPAGITLSILSGILITAITAIWFDRKEVKS